MKFQTNKQKKNFAVVLILLSAIFSGVFSLAFYSPNKAENPVTVYCPLTKKLQPVHGAQLIQTEDTLEKYCLSYKQKSDFSTAVLEKISFGFSISNEKAFEDLVFDYFQDGKSAIDTHSNLPNLPEKTFAKNSFASVGFVSNFGFQVVWKSEESFFFQLKARPPTKTISNRFAFYSLNSLEDISRNINPRSPPFLFV